MYDIIEIARSLDRIADIDEAIIFIFRDFDDAMHEGRFDYLEKTMNSIRVTDFSVDVLLGFLVASLPIRTNPARSDLFNRISKYFDELCLEDKEELLQGLESVQELAKCCECGTVIIPHMRADCCHEALCKECVSKIFSKDEISD